MASDCTVAIDNGYINIRVGAIIMKGNKFLMVGNQKDEYLYSVGGRIQFGESAEEAVVREVFEGTGVRLEVDRLGFAVYGIQRSPFCFRTAVFRSQRPPIC